MPLPQRTLRRATTVSPDPGSPAIGMREGTAKPQESRATWHGPGLPQVRWRLRKWTTPYITKMLYNRYVMYPHGYSCWEYRQRRRPVWTRA